MIASLRTQATISLLLLGTTDYRAGQPQRARQQFLAAGEFETTEQQARQWIEYLDYVQQPEHPDVAGL